MSIYFCKDCGILLDGLLDFEERCISCQEKYLRRMNEPVCKGCKKRETCHLAKKLVIGCESKDENADV